jgi:hypothetical protein
MRELTRRDALSGATALGAVALAGCVSDDDEENGNQSENGNESENGNQSDDGTSGTLSLSGTGIETTESSCASGEGDSATVGVDAGAVVVDGALTAPTPCHEAVIDSAELVENVLSVVVDVADTSGDEACPECVGAIAYEATADFSPDLSDLSELTDITVEHVGGTTYTLDDGELVPGSDESGGSETPLAAVVSRSIETVEATCGGADEHEVTREDGTVTVDGTIPTSNPCHEAVLGSASVTDGTLSVEVGVRSTLAESEVCPSCLGEVTYRAEITLESGASVETVDVRHDTAIESPVREGSSDSGP